MKNVIPKATKLENKYSLIRKGNCLNSLLLLWNKVKCFFDAHIVYLSYEDILKVEDTILNLRTLVWQDAFTAFLLERVQWWSKVTKDQILTQPISSNNTLS